MAEPTFARITVGTELLVYAFRYALGRRTYAVTDVAQALLEHGGALTADARRQIVTEIREAILGGRAGAVCDVDRWDEVAYALMAEEGS